MTRKDNRKPTTEEAAKLIEAAIAAEDWISAIDISTTMRWVPSQDLVDKASSQLAAMFPHAHNVRLEWYGTRPRVWMSSKRK